MVERHSIRGKELITALLINKISEIMMEYSTDLEDYIKIEKDKANKLIKDNIGEIIYEYINRQDGR